MAGKLTGTQREEAKLFWAENERNCSKTAETFGISDTSIANYRDKYHWVKWADEKDAQMYQESLKLAVRGRAAILRNAYKLSDRIRERLRCGPIPMQSIGAELERTTRVVQLLSGGPTERVSVVDGFRQLSSEEQRKIIADLRRT